MDKILSLEVHLFHLLDLGSLLLIFFFDFNFSSSLQLLVWPSTSCLLFNFFFMVLIWKNFYAIVLEGVVKILRRILGKRELMVLHLGKNRELILTKSW
jgi:hypothetical protein